MTIGVGASVGDVVEAAVGLVVVVIVGELVRGGEEKAVVAEGTKLGDKFGEAKFSYALNESFGFLLLSKRPKLESGLSV